ncbi:MAG: multiheme c-type cytochrome [Myxococcota bacterium]
MAEVAPKAERTPPGFVGSAVCTGCHAEQAAAWEPSQHHAAMAIATTGTVAAPFAGEELFTRHERLAFFRGGSAFYVRGLALGAKRVDPNATGDRQMLRITGTFGVAPLQQYLTDPEFGRIQVLPWAWDARPETVGGQRWIDLYPETAGDPSDPLHFSRPAQNWNHVCADCHVTGFRKRYEADRDRFASRWEELGVGCEACHGPGGGHVAWAGRRERGARIERPDDGDRGLYAPLDERRDVVWTIDATTGNAARSRPKATMREIEVCAPCHARRSAISEDWVAGEAFLDHYRPSLLEPGLYWPDGQQRDEVYGWGSFLQSRMFAAGVTCSDCHEPHSGRLRAEGNALCANCHAPSKYATPTHHHHAAGSSGSACIACHMPTTTYMQVDPRHDHNVRVPRPDQARVLGVPDACGGCHGAARSAWAAAAVERWLGRPARGFGRHAEAFAASEAEAIEGAAGLRAIASDASQPAIVRASALARLDATGSPASARLLATAVRDPDPLVRLGAVESLAEAAPAERAAAVPALGDALRAVRFQAVRGLAAIAAGLSASDRARFEREAAAYEAALRRDADRPEMRTQLGLFLAERGDAEGARRELEAAIALEPAFEAAHANLADLERALGRDAAALRVLDAALVRLPESPVLQHARGLALVRLGRGDEALAPLARAVELDPGSSRFAYVYAVALHGSGEVGRALALLERTARAHPSDVAVREALVAFLEAEGKAEAAAPHRAVLARLAQAAE